MASRPNFVSQQTRKINTVNQIYMKKRVLFYLAAIVTSLSMQSCVSNYVVSKPTEYKTDAKVVAITPVKNSDKAVTPSKQIEAALASLRTETKKAEIEKTIAHETKIDALLAEADSYLGTPYRYGGMTRNGIDCSAFVLSVYGAAMGMDLPRVAAAQAGEGVRVDRSELKKGDLVFFSHGGGRISHVGIVHEVTADGEVKFIHAATSRGVMISPLTDKYWGPRFRFAKRIVNADYNTSNYAQN